jgi:hypothetical protein
MGLVAVKRTLPQDAVLADALFLLMEGKLTQSESFEGIRTEFPLKGVELVSTEQRGSVLTLTFIDPEYKTSGGACRVAILRHQIEATAKAFSGATEVRFMPEDIFQP